MKKMNEYIYHIGVTLRIYPSDMQKKIIKKNGAASRFVYNRLVAVHNEIFELKKSASYSPTDKARLEYLQTAYKNAVEMKSSLPFLYEKEIDSDMVLNALLSYRTAWNQFKKVREASVPTFHKFDNTYSYKTSNHYGKNAHNGLLDGSVRFLDKNHVHLPKIGRIRCKGSAKIIDALLSRTVETRIGSCKVWMDQTGKCYISISCGSDAPFYEKYPSTKKAVGVDLNLSNFLTDSECHVVESPKYLAKSEKKLKKMQRRLSKKQEAAKKANKKLWQCKRYQKLRKKIAALHKHIANQRKDFHYMTATKIVKQYDFVFLEDLKVRNLKKNSKLAKAISDSGWNQFLTIIQWLSNKRGKLCLLVEPNNTTQTCSSCGHVCKGEEHIELGVEEWVCPNCGTRHVRDHNAAVNIMNKGLLKLEEAGIEPALI